MDIEIAGKTVTIDEDRISGNVANKVEAYLDGDQPMFNETIRLDDLTAFNRDVLSTVRDIPYGRTVTYAHIARRIGRNDAARAVAQACNGNPCPIVIPCHRVVADDGIGGYKYGKAVKRHLLELEDALPDD